jgi:hypothetical protein
MDLLRDIKENCCFVRCLALASPACLCVRRLTWFGCSCDIALDTHLANNTTFLNKEYRVRRVVEFKTMAAFSEYH